MGALVMAGVTWVSSSGVISKVLTDLGRVGNRETPNVLAVLVIEDLAMAFYLPILSAFVMGASIVQGAITVAIAVGSVFVVLLVALRFGKRISRFFSSTHIESLVIGVLGLAMLVAGLAATVQVSSAVGAFLVGIAISGEVAKMAQKYLRPVRDLFAAFFFLVFGLTTDSTAILGALLPAAILAVVTIGTKVLTGYIGARRAGIGRAGRWRAGFALTPRGEFSIIIAGLAVAAGLEPAIAPVAATYMLITVVVGPLLSRVSDTQAFKRRFRSTITQPLSLPPAR
jgi:CPA2 family monovalent cation:H+ antiporter-2